MKSRTKSPFYTILHVLIESQEPDSASETSDPDPENPDSTGSETANLETYVINLEKKRKK